VQPTLCVGDGHSYEQAAIARWLQAHSTSPVTGQALAITIHYLGFRVNAFGRALANASSQRATGGI
jgi:hypothetical protein